MTSMTPAMNLALQANFGSAERWRAQFVALGEAQAGEAGRRVLAVNPQDGRLVNRWMSDTDTDNDGGGGVPLLTVRTGPLDAGPDLAGLDWAAPYERYQQAVHDASEPFGADAADLRGAVLLVDVRRSAMFEQATTMLPRARWHDPAEVSTWAASLPASRGVVVYCVYGHEVSRATALRLRAAGMQARFLRGGIDGWQAAGRPLDAKAGAG